MLIDSHCHLNYLQNPELAIAEAVRAGVSGCLCIGVEERSIQQVLTMAQSTPGVWCSVGEHPGSCSGDAQWVARHLQEPGVVAVGEMGLDYYYEKDSSAQAKQRKTFQQQMQLAQESNLPVIIHTRDAEQDTLDIMREFSNVVGVLHCFTESWEMARQALDLGYYVSISGIVTFKNAQNVRDVAAKVPLDRLLIETDAPWLTPVPHRGKENQPGYVADTAAFLSELLDVELENLATQTRRNFFALFQQADESEHLSAV